MQRTIFSVSFETIGELSAAAAATSLFDTTVTEHDILSNRLAFGPGLWNRELQPSTPFVSTFHASDTFSPGEVVIAMRKVVAADEVLDPYPTQPKTPDYEVLLAKSQKRLVGELTLILGAYDSSIRAQLKDLETNKGISRRKE